VTVPAFSDLCVASTDVIQAPSTARNGSGELIVDRTTALPAGALHAFCPGDFTMTLCGEPLTQLHRWNATWTGHPAQNCCRLCLAAALVRAQHHARQAEMARSRSTSAV
jgi:hypothetical protein